MSESTEKKYFIDDRCIIPDYIKKMNSEELDAAIAFLEKRIRSEKAAKQERIKALTDGLATPDHIKEMDAWDIDREIAFIERELEERRDIEQAKKAG